MTRSTYAVGNLLENLFRGEEAHLYKVHRVPGDGKCFYHSLSWCLSGGIRNSELLKQLAEVHHPNAVAVSRSNGGADSTNIENIERQLNIKCIFLSKTMPFAKNLTLPRVIATPFGDGVDPAVTSDMPHRVTRYVFMAYDEESHFSPITFKDMGHFAIDEIPENIRLLLSEALPPFKTLLAQANHHHHQFM